MAFDKNHMTPAMKVVVVIFAVILVLMLMLPSLSAIMTNSSTQTSQQQQAAQAEQSGPSSVSDLDKLYEPAIDSLNKRLESDPTNVAMLNDLANAYFDWALNLSLFMQSQDDIAHQQDLFGKAVSTYDKIIEKSPSNSVKVDRAIAQFYGGDQEGAITYLEKFTSETPDFAQGWANLGLFYEVTGSADKARAAYDKGLAVAGSDEQIKAFIESRKSNMDSSANGSAESKGQVEVKSAESSLATNPAATE